jgi:CheY-like chemotaxis protein
MPVLVVSDNATGRRILGKMLSHLHMKAKAVKAGVPSSLTLADCGMRDLDGFGLVRRIRQAPRLYASQV